MLGGWVFIMTNRPNAPLYLGVTNDLARRAWEHREGRVRGFTRRYGLKRLVSYEPHDDIRAAIQREKTMKHWSRAWNVRLILETNPQWRASSRGPARSQKNVQPSRRVRRSLPQALRR